MIMKSQCKKREKKGEKKELMQNKETKKKEVWHKENRPRKSSVCSETFRQSNDAKKTESE